MDGALARAGQPSLSSLGARAAIDLSEVQVGGLTRFGWALLLAATTAAAAWTYLAHQIRRALGSVLEGSAFRAENHGRLRRIAYAVFASFGAFPGTTARASDRSR